MKILSINIFYGEGSTGKILEDIHNRLERDGHESYIVYGLGKKKPSEGGKFYRTTSPFWNRQYSRIARITGLRYNCAYFETWRLIKHIKKINPDIVHLHCLNCSYVNPFILLRWLGKHNYNVLVTHHADVIITANCDYAYECELWKTGCRNGCKALKEQNHFLFHTWAGLSWKQMGKAFRYVHRLYSSGVSRWMTERVQQSPFFNNKECYLIENGIDTTSFHYDVENSNNIIKELKSDGSRVVIHVTPSILRPIKGSSYVLELARRMPSVKFLIVGFRNEPFPAVPDNVTLIPYVGSKKELASFYQNADVSILPSKKESFSLVTAESLCCGTPVVGFKAGAPETIALPEYSSFVEYGNIDSLQRELELYLNKKFDKALISKSACEKFDSDLMYDKYVEYYKSIIEKSAYN